MTKSTKRAEANWAGEDWDWLLAEMSTKDYNWKQHSTIDLLGLLRQQGCREIPELHALVKAELDKRPNIPTKAQAKEKRKQVMKEKQNR